jgi:hypothetical protein
MEPSEKIEILKTRVSKVPRFLKYEKLKSFDS